MKTTLLLLRNTCCPFLFVILLFSCNNENTNITVEKAIPEQGRSNISNFHIYPEAITKDFNTWYTYTYHNINLSQDFTGMDTNAVVVQKDTFLNLLKTGKYLPIKVAEKEQLPQYKLYSLHSSVADIGLTLKQIAEEEQARYHMLGKELPAFNYTDLKGNNYTAANTKGKIVVLKCWFIHCVACVKEFPELNKLVEEHKNDNDILFVSLAMDAKQDLYAFLKKNTFNYAVVPVSEEYMMSKLNIQSFPTHIVIGKGGKIAAVTGNYEDLSYALKKELAKG